MTDEIVCLLLCLAARTLLAGHPADASCTAGELPCASGQCVGWKAWCDGPSDCRDGSDEDYCRTLDPLDANGAENPNGCDASGHFVCESGMCIPRAGRCDDIPNCEEGEDEENCDYVYDTTSDAERSSTTTTAAPSPASPEPPTWLPSRGDVFRKSLRHVIEMRDAEWGWGRATPRVVTALSLADESYFDPDNHDGLMTKKQLEVQLALDLMRHSEKPLRFHDLVNYVQALVATCLDPRDFHGVNVVRLLKKSMVQRQARGLFVGPLAYLALCNARDFSDTYLRKLKNMAYRRSEEQRWLDVQSYALLAISCRTLSNRSDARQWLPLQKNVAKNITEWQQADGSFGNVYSTGLALQALLAAEEPDTESSKGRAATYLLSRVDWQGSFGHEVDNYYVLPALNGKSLAHLHARNCKTDPHAAQNTEAAVDRQMRVHYSLWIGGDRSEIHTLTLDLPRRSGFEDVMRAAQDANPRYKYETLSTGRGTTVLSIAGRSSNLEKSTYWTLYRRVPLPFKPALANVTATVARLKLFGAKRWGRDLKKLHPKDGEHLAFWYKPYL